MTPTFITMPSRVVNWDADQAVIEEEPVTIPASLPASSVRFYDKVKTESPPQPIRTRNRVGNGHKKQHTRDFTPREIDYMRGYYEEGSKTGWTRKKCTELYNRMVQNGSTDLSIWQVTGYISRLISNKIAQYPKPEIRNTPFFKAFPRAGSYYKG